MTSLFNETLNNLERIMNMKKIVLTVVERETKVNEAIKKDLSYMRYILNNRQYREYVKFLNVTLNNRGLTK